jgi:hypothetical protein
LVKKDETKFLGRYVRQADTRHRHRHSRHRHRQRKRYREPASFVRDSVVAMKNTHPESSSFSGSGRHLQGWFNREVKLLGAREGLVWKLIKNFFFGAVVYAYTVILCLVQQLASLNAMTQRTNGDIRLPDYRPTSQVGKLARSRQNLVLTENQSDMTSHEATFMISPPRCHIISRFLWHSLHHCAKTRLVSP